MIFILGSDEGWGLLGAAPGEQGNLIDTPASNRTASLSSDFHVGSHPRFHLRQNNNNNSNEKSYDGLKNGIFILGMLYQKLVIIM